MIKLIVACDENRGIGKDNELPWSSPEDMRHFKRTTMGHYVVMGRKTFESIGSKGLKGRVNFVLSRTLPLLQKDAIVERHSSILLQKLQRDPFDSYIIGGEQIYKEFLPHADEVILTQMEGNYECDSFFPVLSTDDWELVDQHFGKEIVIYYFKKRKKTSQ
jgi:dihydrofolate reductase